MKKIADVIYSQPESECKLDVYLPDTKASAVFVYFHGGGLQYGDKKDAEIFAPCLAARGIALVSVSYRMYPNAKFPDFLFDAARSVAWANKYMREELGCDRLYVGGSSAGGYISMMLCFDKQYLASAGIDNSVITGYFHDAGQPTAHFKVLKASGVDPRRIIVDSTAPLYYIGMEEKYPRMRFIVSDNDMENRYEQTMLVLSTLKHFGYTDYDHIVMHGGHCEYCMKADENGDGILGKMVADFIESRK